MAEQIDGKDGIGGETEGRSCAFPRPRATGSDADGCYVGIMSGTSMDGADAAACYFDGATMTMVARASEPFSKRLRRALLDAQNAEGPDALRRCGLLKVSLTRAYVAVARKLLGLPEMKGVPIAAIGCHKSQMAWMEHFMKDDYLETMRAQSRFRGFQWGCKYAEAFEAYQIQGFVADYRLIPR